MRFILPVLMLLAFSCASTESKKSATDSVVPVVAAKPEFKKGDLTTLYVTGDPSNSFTVYLPSDFDSTKKYPLVVFFDPHADGSLPLNKYKSLAEKWGFIFAGSNTSKNGMTPDQTMKIGNALIGEMTRIINVEKSEIILCGFSGGARVASNLALTRPDIKALICNSAAPSQPVNGKTFVGLAGLGDMNYLELKKFVDAQKKMGYKAPEELLPYEGNHEWAPEAIMEDALLITGCYQESGAYAGKDSLMAIALEKNLLKQADEIKKASCLIESAYLETGIRCTRELYSPNELVNRNDKLRQTSCFINDVDAWLKAESEENQLQQELASALMSQDTTWWKINSPKYFESKKQGADKFMHQRLRGYASLMCYSYANQAFKSNNLHAAEKLVAVYAIVDPENSEWAYMRANLYMQIGLNDYALNSLEKAASLGFKDKIRLQNDPVFAPLRNDPRFAALLGKMI